MTRLDAIEALIGLVLLVAGVAMVHVPSALIVAGAVLMFFALTSLFFATRRHGGPPR
jgi:hypothetical protein